MSHRLVTGVVVLLGSLAVIVPAASATTAGPQLTLQASCHQVSAPYGVVATAQGLTPNTLYSIEIVYPGGPRGPQPVMSDAAGRLSY